MDLRTEFPQTEGFSRTNLYYIKQWYEFFSAESEFVHQPGGQIKKINIDDCSIPGILLRVPWKHQVVIVSKCDTTQAALFYLNKVVQDNLSRSELEHIIKARLYEHAGKALN